MTISISIVDEERDNLNKVRVRPAFEYFLSTFRVSQQCPKYLDYASVNDSSTFCTGIEKLASCKLQHRSIDFIVREPLELPSQRSDCHESLNWPEETASKMNDEFDTGMCVVLLPHYR